MSTESTLCFTINRLSYHTMGWLLLQQIYYLRFYELTWVSANTRLFPGIPPTLSGIQVDMMTGWSISWSWSMHGPCSPEVRKLLRKAGMLPHACKPEELKQLIVSSISFTLWLRGQFTCIRTCLCVCLSACIDTMGQCVSVLLASLLGCDTVLLGK